MIAFPRFAAIAICVGLGACAQGDQAQEAGSDTAAAAAAAQPAQTTAGPSDAEIVAVARTANNADIEGGNLARTKAQHPDVKAFAQLMIADHTAMNQQADQVARTANLTPTRNTQTQQMEADHHRASQELHGKSGADFDRAYIDHEVRMHQTVLNSLDQTLIPNARHAELRNMLQQARAKVEAHLRRAEQIRNRL